MSKKLNILVTDEAALEAAIEPIRGRATTWTHPASGIRNVAELAESRLAKAGLPPSHSVGVVAVHTSMGPESNSYDYGVTGSRITLKRSRDGWRFVGYEKIGLYPKQGGKLDLTFQERHREAMVAAILRNNRITVKSATTEQKEAA
ncbi:hypothetical protein BB934_45340 (plasmid) [Microvirga ossetica]|uniref:Uncharacterized protein n=1 Tax=Microvirga ossetica TaxID=1882682 RepID=A0A1B2EZQ9_9HYPH|nr:hypothetical protein [Microvirga ossetica]ANY85446.1 hypothetical protein BB934_45340 [Microvirga ossetica]